MNPIYVICYDIFDNQRRRRISRLLESAGTRVQESLFELTCPPVNLRQLVQQLIPLIDPVCDHIRIYPLCARDYSNLRIMGISVPPMNRLFWI